MHGQMRVRCALRWTIGNVSREGFEALGFSVRGARRIFGPSARYAICHNSIDVKHARDLTGELPSDVEWIDCNDLIPAWLRRHVDRDMAQGVGWKFAPVRLFPKLYEIAIDNDCILWDMPDTLRSAISIDRPRCLIAADVKTCFGQFADLCGSEPRNSGIRGTPPEFDLESRLQRLLASRDCMLRSETDEQGLQVAALNIDEEALVVSVRDVTICSPFPPHVPHLGRCGAHFVGLNAHTLPWSHDGLPASQVRRDHWHQRKANIAAKIDKAASHQATGN